MDLKTINQELKDIELGNVKMEKDHYHKATYKTYENKTVKGIQGGSIGPMTSTDAHQNHNFKIEAKVREILGHLSDKVISEGMFTSYYINLGKKTRIFKFHWSLFPTYAHNEYDLSYQSYWYVLQTNDIKN